MEIVDLRIPPRPEYISVARLATAAVAAHRAFTYDQIEDLKVAVSEACGMLIRSRRGGGDPIALRFVEEADALDITVEAHGADVDPRTLFPDPDATGHRDATAGDERELCVFLMHCLVDEVRRSSGDGGIALRLRKRQRENPNGSPPSAE
ncbi:MAG TPA: ATP-binding protein [Candidatus Dormibacteraeota bacterium]|nr:ATP-binding protein [Candidatus Dormibacteraeota bacterium]